MAAPATSVKQGLRKDIILLNVARSCLTLNIECTYDAHTEPRANEAMPAAVKITEPTRTARLRRPLLASVTRDAGVPGLALHVTTRRAFWALSYQPRGVNPATGKRWGGGVRHELGDAMLVTVAEARTAALAAKALVRAGRSPHHERLASTANTLAQRAILPRQSLKPSTHTPPRS